MVNYPLLLSAATAASCWSGADAWYRFLLSPAQPLARGCDAFREAQGIGEAGKISGRGADGQVELAEAVEDQLLLLPAHHPELPAEHQLGGDVRVPGQKEIIGRADLGSPPELGESRRVERRGAD